MRNHPPVPTERPAKEDRPGAQPANDGERQSNTHTHTHGHSAHLLHYIVLRCIFKVLMMPSKAAVPIADCTRCAPV